MKRHLTFFAIAGLASASPAVAADFTLDVPVRIENMPSVTGIRVSCAILTGGSAGRLVASGQSGPVAVTGGNYEGTVTVEIDNRGLTPSLDARAYSCGIEAQGTARTGGTYAASPDNFVDVYQRATGHMLVRTTTHARGAIP